MFAQKTLVHMGTIGLLASWLVFPGLVGAKEDPIPLLNEVLGKLDQLQGEVTTLQGTVQGVEAKVTSVQTDVQMLKTTATTLQGAVQGLETNVTSVQTDVQTLQTTVNGVQTDVDGLETNVSNLQTSVSTLQNTDVANLQADVSMVKDAVGDLETGVDLRGVTQNWDKKLDSTNGDADGCNSDRFTCVFSGAVRDNETGLVWEEFPDISGGAGFDGKRDWITAVRHCTSVRRVGGRRGWTMPTVEQLASLVDPSSSDPSVLALPNGHPFKNIKLDSYWTATAVAESPLAKRVVRFHDGAVSSLAKFGNNLVWCVRGGQNFDGNDVSTALHP